MVLRWLKVKFFLISFRIWPARASPSPSQCCRLRTAHSQAGGDNIRHPSRKIKQVYNWILCCMIFFYFLLHQAMGQQLFKLNHCFVGERGGACFFKDFFAAGVCFPPFPKFYITYYTMILQRIRIIVGDAGFKPGPLSPEVRRDTNEPPHLLMSHYISTACFY